jgi:hypothetical protein
MMTKKVSRNGAYLKSAPYGRDPLRKRKKRKNTARKIIPSHNIAFQQKLLYNTHTEAASPFPPRKSFCLTSFIL